MAKGKHILCKNDICVNTRTIFHSPRGKNTQKQINKTIYYFYNLDDKKLYRLRKEKYDMLKDKRGYLLQFKYRYFINEFLKPQTHKLMTDIMLFTKHTQQEINSNSEIDSKMPFDFGRNNSEEANEINPETISIKDESKTVDKSKFETYIQDTINDFKEKYDFNKLEKLNFYVDTYANLLDKYYNECIHSNIDVFKIKYMA